MHDVTEIFNWKPQANSDTINFSSLIATPTLKGRVLGCKRTTIETIGATHNDGFPPKLYLISYVSATLIFAKTVHENVV